MTWINHCKWSFFFEALDQDHHTLVQYLSTKLSDAASSLGNSSKDTDFNAQPTQINKEKKYDIFISYRRHGNGTDIKLFRDRLIQSGFSIWHDDICLSSGYGQDYQRNLIKGINNSKFFFIYLE